MDLLSAVVHHLGTLTDDLDEPGADLQAMLEVLLDDVTTAVPSFCGLRIELTGPAYPLVDLWVPRQAAESAPEPARSPPVRASLQVPVPPLASAKTVTTLTFYAGASAAFDVLAADLRLACGLDGEIVVDEHLHLWPPAGGDKDRDDDRGTDAVDQAVVINQALGLLIGLGHLPEAAWSELRRQAHVHGIDTSARARQLLAGLTDAREPGFGAPHPSTPRPGERHRAGPNGQDGLASGHAVP